MKRITLCESAFIDLTEEEYNKCEKINVVDEKTGELMFISKKIILPKNIFLVVPLFEIKDIND